MIAIIARLSLLMALLHVAWAVEGGGKNELIPAPASQEKMPLFPYSMIAFGSSCISGFITNIGNKEPANWTHAVTDEEYQDMCKVRVLPPQADQYVKTASFYQHLARVPRVSNQINQILFSPSGEYYRRVASIYPTLHMIDGTSEATRWFRSQFVINNATAFDTFLNTSANHQVIDNGSLGRMNPLRIRLTPVQCGENNGAIGFPDLTPYLPDAARTANAYVAMNGFVTPTLVQERFTVQVQPNSNTGKPYPGLSYWAWKYVNGAQARNFAVFLPKITRTITLEEPIDLGSSPGERSKFQQAFTACIAYMNARMAESNATTYDAALELYKRSVASGNPPKDPETNAALGEPPKPPTMATAPTVTVYDAPVDENMTTTVTTAMNGAYGNGLVYLYQEYTAADGTKHSVRTSAVDPVKTQQASAGKIDCGEVEQHIAQIGTNPHALGCLLLPPAQGGFTEAITHPYRGTADPGLTMLTYGGQVASLLGSQDDKSTEGWLSTLAKILNPVNWIEGALKAMLSLGLFAVGVVAAIFGGLVAILSGHLIGIALMLTLLAYPVFAAVSLFRPMAILDWARGLLYVMAIAIPISIGTAIIWNCLFSWQTLTSAMSTLLMPAAGPITTVAMGMVAQTDTVMIKTIGLIIGSGIIMSAPAIVQVIINPTAGAIGGLASSVFSMGVRAGMQAAVVGAGAGLVAAGNFGVGKDSAPPTPTAANPGSNASTGSSAAGAGEVATTGQAGGGGRNAGGGSGGGTGAPAGAPRAGASGKLAETSPTLTGQLASAGSSAASAAGSAFQSAKESLKALRDDPGGALADAGKRAGASAKEFAGDMNKQLGSQVAAARDMLGSMAQSAKSDGIMKTASKVSDKVGGAVAMGDMTAGGDLERGARKADTRSPEQKQRDAFSAKAQSMDMQGSPQGQQGPAQPSGDEGGGQASMDIVAGVAPGADVATPAGRQGSSAAKTDGAVPGPAKSGAGGGRSSQGSTIPAQKAMAQAETAMSEGRWGDALDAIANADRGSIGGGSAGHVQQAAMCTMAQRAHAGMAKEMSQSAAQTRAHAQTQALSASESASLGANASRLEAAASVHSTKAAEQGKNAGFHMQQASMVESRMCKRFAGQSPDLAADHGIQALMYAAESGNPQAISSAEQEISGVLASTPSMTASPSGQRLAAAVHASKGDLNTASATAHVPLMTAPAIDGPASPEGRGSAAMAAEVLPADDPAGAGQATADGAPEPASPRIQASNLGQQAAAAPSAPGAAAAQLEATPPASSGSKSTSTTPTADRIMAMKTLLDMSPSKKA